MPELPMPPGLKRAADMSKRISAQMSEVAARNAARAENLSSLPPRDEVLISILQEIRRTNELLEKLVEAREG